MWRVNASWYKLSNDNQLWRILCDKFDPSVMKDYQSLRPLVVQQEWMQGRFTGYTKHTSWLVSKTRLTIESRQCLSRRISAISHNDEHGQTLPFGARKESAVVRTIGRTSCSIFRTLFLNQTLLYVSSVWSAARLIWKGAMSISQKGDSQAIYLKDPERILGSL